MDAIPDYDFVKKAEGRYCVLKPSAAANQDESLDCAFRGGILALKVTIMARLVIVFAALIATGLASGTDESVPFWDALDEVGVLAGVGFG